MSWGTRGLGRGALPGLGAVALLTAACSGGGSAGSATSSSTTTSARGSSTTAGPAPAGPAVPKAATTTTKVGATTTSTGGAPASTSTTGAHAATTVRVDATQNGRTVALHVGDTLQISLTGCADCGYSWRMTGQPSPVVFSYEGEQTTTPSTSTTAGQPPAVGQPVTWVWTFKAVSAHTTGFIAQYYPPGQGARSTQTFAVQLRVSA